MTFVIGFPNSGWILFRQIPVSGLTLGIISLGFAAIGALKWSLVDRNTSPVILDSDGITLPNRKRVPWENFKEVYFSDVYGTMICEIHRHHGIRKLIRAYHFGEDNDSAAALLRYYRDHPASRQSLGSIDSPAVEWDGTRPSADSVAFQNLLN